MNPISDLELAVGLLGNEGPGRVFSCGPEQADALWRLRSYEIVEWGARRDSGGFRFAGPIPVLTPIGRQLALRELG